MKEQKNERKLSENKQKNNKKTWHEFPPNCQKRFKFANTGGKFFSFGSMKISQK